MNRSASELDGHDLVLSHFTLSRHHPIGERVQAASAAGFAGIGLYTGDVARMMAEGMELAELADLLEANGLVLSDIEVVQGWGGGPMAQAGAATEETAWLMADRMHARCFQAIGPYEGEPSDGARAFGELCDRAADHGLVVALEPLPYTNVSNTADALEIVERAGRRNGGLCLDIWHHSRAHDDRRLLAGLDPALIKNVQMNDGPLDPPTQDLADYKDDCLRHRIPPGEGEMDAVGFVSALLEAGSTAPWSVEVPNEAAWQGCAVDHVVACADAMRRVLGEARSVKFGQNLLGPRTA